MKAITQITATHNTNNTPTINTKQQPSKTGKTADQHKTKGLEPQKRAFKMDGLYYKHQYDYLGNYRTIFREPRLHVPLIFPIGKPIL